MTAKFRLSLNRHLLFPPFIQPVKYRAATLSVIDSSLIPPRKIVIVIRKRIHEAHTYTSKYCKIVAAILTLILPSFSQLKIICAFRAHLVLCLSFLIPNIDIMTNDHRMTSPSYLLD